MRGIVFQTGIDTLKYVTLITENFDTKTSSNSKYLGVIELVMVSSRCLMQTRGPGALYRAREYHCNLVLFFF